MDEGNNKGFSCRFHDAAGLDEFKGTLTFPDAEVRGDPAVKKQLSIMGSVAGGGDDSVVLFYKGLPTI